MGRLVKYAVLSIFCILPMSLFAEVDLPGRVGRVSELYGQLYLASDQPQAQWESIGLNFTIIGGDNLWLTPNGRVEIDYGSGLIWLAGGANVHISALDDQKVALQLASGPLVVRIRELDAGETVTLYAEGLVVELRQRGWYRFEVSPELTTLVVREGQAVLRLAGGSQVIRSGQIAQLSGYQGQMLSIRDGLSSDGFDSWVEVRERRLHNSRSSSHVSQQLIGWRDLEEHGEWENDASYGALWYPRSVAVGWAPYRYGHWRWIRHWGWTWIDDAAWGFAPFHYGRWVWIRGRWAWGPGRWVGRPIYAPALVAFYGGANWSLSLRAPHYGWVPLGWGDPYWPCYRYSERYWQSINRPFVPALPHRPGKPRGSSHEHLPGALTVVPDAIFTGAKPVAPHRVLPPATVLRDAPVLSGSTYAIKPAPTLALTKPLIALPEPASVLLKPERTVRYRNDQPSSKPLVLDTPVQAPQADPVLPAKPAPRVPVETPSVVGTPGVVAVPPALPATPRYDVQPPPQQRVKPWPQTIPQTIPQAPPAQTPQPQIRPARPPSAEYPFQPHRGDAPTSRVVPPAVVQPKPQVERQEKPYLSPERPAEPRKQEQVAPPARGTKPLIN